MFSRITTWVLFECKSRSATRLKTARWQASLTRGSLPRIDHAVCHRPAVGIEKQAPKNLVAAAAAERAVRKIIYTSSGRGGGEAGEGGGRKEE